MGMGIREAMSEMGVFTSEGKVVGACLGFDFTSEHEVGIKELRAKFLCDREKAGLESGKINGGSVYTGAVTHGETIWHYITSEENQEYLLKDSTHWPSRQEEGTPYKVKAGWGEGGFIFFCTEFEVISRLKELFDSKDMALLMGASGPFNNGGLKLIQYSVLPQELLDKAVQEQMAKKLADETFHNSQAFLNLKAKAAEWRKKYPFAHGTPWEYFALSPQGGSEKVWLNPHHQQHLSFGWISQQDVQDWVDGKVGAVIRSQEDWDDLCWECSVPVGTLFGLRKNRSDDYSTYTKYFRRIPPNLHRKRDDSLPVFKKPGKHASLNTLPDECLVIMESDIKKELLSSMFRQIKVYGFEDYINRPGGLEFFKERYQMYLDSGNKETIRPSKEAMEYSQGMRYSLCILGFGRYGACNVPEGRGRANLSFWQSVMEAEVSYDFLYLCGALPYTREILPYKTMEEILQDEVHKL
jgi:hypothetical protein